MDWQQEIKAYEKERPKLNSKELGLKQELLSIKQQQINQYHQVVEKQIEEATQITQQAILQDINQFIKKYGDEHPYPIILGALGNGNIMYAKESINITEKVLQELNAHYMAQHSVGNPIKEHPKSE